MTLFYIDSLLSLNDEEKAKEKAKRKRNRIYARSEEANIRRNLRRRAHPFPRLPKNDLRRDFTKIFTNVINSGDRNLFDLYVQKFFAKNSTFAKLTSSELSHWKPVVHERLGSQAFTTYFTKLIDDIPDFLISLYNTQVRLDPVNNRSLIVSKIRLTGTKVKAPKLNYLMLLRNMIEEKQEKKKNAGIDVDFNWESNTANQLVDFQEDIVEERLADSNCLYYDPETKARLWSSSESDYDSIDDSSVSSQTTSSTHSSLTIHTNKQGLTHPMSLPLPDCDIREDNPMVLLNPSLRLTIDGYLTMHVDEDFMITKFEMLNLESSITLKPARPV